MAQQMFSVQHMESGFIFLAYVIFQMHYSFNLTTKLARKIKQFNRYH